MGFLGFFWASRILDWSSLGHGAELARKWPVFLAECVTAGCRRHADLKEQEFRSSKCGASCTSFLSSSAWSRRPWAFSMRVLTRDWRDSWIPKSMSLALATI